MIKLFLCAVLGFACIASYAQSTLRVNVAASLRPLVAHVPFPNFNERDYPIDDKTVRFDLRIRSGPTFAIGADGSLQVFVDYYGDIQKFAFPLGTLLDPSLCHLGDSPGVWDPRKTWVLLGAQVAVTPVVVQEGGAWIVRAGSTAVKLFQEPGSDTKCTIFAIDEGSQIDSLLGGRLRSQVQNAIQGVSIPVPLGPVLGAINNTIAVPIPQLPIPGGATACVKVNLQHVTAGPLQSLSGGTIDNVQVPVTITMNPTVTILAGGTPCPN